MTALPNKHYSGHCIARPQKKSATKEHLEQRSAESNVDSMFQMQLEEEMQDRAGWRQVVCGCKA